MKSKIKNLIEMLKELIPETYPDRRAYNELQLIPVPAKSGEEKKPKPYNR